MNRDRHDEFATRQEKQASKILKEDFFLPAVVQYGAIKDHINPETWKGDCNPANVDLTMCWKKGALLAKEALTKHDVFADANVNFDAIAATGATMLTPIPGKMRPGVIGCS